MAKITADVFDERILKYADVCLREGARKAPKGWRISVNREGYPQLTFSARGQEAYYKIFDKFEMCLTRKKPRGRHPCAKVRGVNAHRDCVAKRDALRKIELAKFKKKYRGRK